MTIISTRYFAWVNSGEAFNPAVHNRNDEDVVSLTVEQSEGDFATATVVIRNPKVGLLAPARKIWAWLSCIKNGVVTPLFFGRLVGVPTDINKASVTLQFVARPPDFVALKSALAQTLKVHPFYDDIWIDPQSLDDPDTVLEGYSALWSIDRTTLAVDVSDILVGEDGVEEFQESDVPFDSVSIKLGQTPLRSVTVDAIVNWTQQASGGLSFGINVETYTGESLMQEWPKVGASLGGGWVVKSSDIRDLYRVEDVFTVSNSYNWQNVEKTHANGDTMSLSQSTTKPLLFGPTISHVMSELHVIGVVDPGDSLSDVWGGDDPLNRPARDEISTMYVPLSRIVANMTIGYEAARPRKEHIRFTLNANTQPIVTMPDEADAINIKLNSVDVGLPIVGDYEGVPLVDPSRRSFLPTDRGLETLEYLIAVARANLIARSRAVEITFKVNFARAIELSCRKNALLHDHRLPGHQAVGKITNYSFSIDGSSGEASGWVTIGCAIGYGGAIAADPGTPDYVDDDYVEEGYQTYTGTLVVLPAGDVGYIVPEDVPNDDGLHFPLTKAQAVVKEQIHGSKIAQESIIEASFPVDILVEKEANPTTVEEQEVLKANQAKTTSQVLQTNSVWYELVLRSLTSKFETGFEIEMTGLEIPKQVDLEAAI